MNESTNPSANHEQPMYDVVIVGAGVAGALAAKSLAIAGLKVLILEAGDEIKPNNNDYLGRYYASASKVPESPYTPSLFEAASPKKNTPPPVAMQDDPKRVAKIVRGIPSDATLRDPKTVKAGRPTVLSISVRAWQQPEKVRWSDDADRKKCRPDNPDVNYFDHKGALPFGSTYERIAGGTARHWMGISLRHLPHDFTMGTNYKTFTDRYGGASQWPDWPVGYDDLKDWYARAEGEIGVAGDSAKQKDLEISLKVDNAQGYAFPMAPIPLSYSDKEIHRILQMPDKIVEFPSHSNVRIRVGVTQLPVARNSEPFNRRRACAGNSSCIPVCPIQAKYDPTITLREAMNLGVTLVCRAVAYRVEITSEGDNHSVSQIHYHRYQNDFEGGHTSQSIKARAYILAANAIETPRLLLMSDTERKVWPEKSALGRHLMDHPFYIASGLMKDPVFQYRGPLVTGGIEMLRDGDFRSKHAAFRTDVSNSGWSLTTHGSAQSLTEDFVMGTNNSGRNGGGEVLGGTLLVKRLNDILTRQVGLGFLVEQTPDPENRVTLSNLKDGLGLPRPRIEYDFSVYTKDGLAEAAAFARRVFDALGCEHYTDEPGPGVPVPDDACSFAWPNAETREPSLIRYMGAGHIAGTCRMGSDRETSVVDANLKLWGFDNCFVLGSAVFPTIGTANPTLTIAALSLRLGDLLSDVLKGART